MTTADIITHPELRAVLDAAMLAQQQCDALLSLMAKHPLNPTKGPGGQLPREVADEISSAQKVLHAHLAIVRNRNRKALLGVRATKLETANARHGVDTLHLALQNLYSEQHYLESEIKACQAYDHPFRKLRLMPEAEFVNAFPDVVAACRDAARKAASESTKKANGNVDGNDNDSHPMEAVEEGAEYVDDVFDDLLMKARIEHEHRERLALEEMRQTLLKKKQRLIAENKQRKDDLAKLDESLERFIEAAKPIEQTFQKAY